ncbi:MAG: hypothetical protein E4H00_02480 [Myxococcales bacterium]|nr:MAG: hypothetical protein E4H00_02480 [Myxococcales bacterium]
MSTPHSVRLAPTGRGLAWASFLWVALLLEPASALAGGYDIPVINTAKHGGMGGTAISYVEGGTSLYLNPAGLGRVGRGNIDLAATVLDGRAQGTPTFLSPDINLESERIPVFFPFVSGAARLTDFLTIGVAAYIVGGAGGEYVYKINQNDEAAIADKTELLLQESTIGIAFNIDRIGLHIGAGYRVTFGRLDRKRPDPFTALDLVMKGVSYTGFRVGFEWQLTDYLSIGAVYRNKITVGVSQNGGSALNNDFENVSTDLILPARTGGGIRFDWGSFGTAVDFEWIFNSQNEAVTFHTEPALPQDIINVFGWSDQWLIRWGGEYRLFDDQWPLRLGFIYGSASTSASFPNAFAPPPSPEYYFTLGTGFNHDPWQVSFAYARGFASTYVDVSTSGFLAECPNCGGPGQYVLKANHFLFDFSYNWR